MLDDNLKTPYKVVASQGGDAVSVKWMAPLGDPREIRYDDGRFERSLGLEQGTASSVFGRINRTPSVVYGCRFHIASRVEIPNHYSVSLYVIDLDEDGNPTDKVLYSNSYVPVTDDVWTEFELPAPVDCPNGYMMGVAYSGILSLSIDNGENLVPYVNCYCSDYATGKWYYLDDSDFKSNFAFQACQPLTAATEGDMDEIRGKTLSAGFGNVSDGACFPGGLCSEGARQAYESCGGQNQI